jgi:hypothetical protein
VIEARREAISLVRSYWVLRDVLSVVSPPEIPANAHVELGKGENEMA